MVYGYASCFFARNYNNQIFVSRCATYKNKKKLLFECLKNFTEQNNSNNGMRKKDIEG